MIAVSIYCHANGNNDDNLQVKIISEESIDIHNISTKVTMGMSTDGQLCVRPMPTAGCAMSKVRRQSCQYSLSFNALVQGRSFNKLWFCLAKSEKYIEIKSK